MSISEVLSTLLGCSSDCVVCKTSRFLLLFYTMDELWTVFFLYSMAARDHEVVFRTYVCFAAHLHNYDIKFDMVLWM